MYERASVSGNPVLNNLFKRAKPSHGFLKVRLGTRSQEKWNRVTSPITIPKACQRTGWTFITARQSETRVEDINTTADVSKYLTDMSVTPV